MKSKPGDDVNKRQDRVSARISRPSAANCAATGLELIAGGW